MHSRQLPLILAALASSQLPSTVRAQGPDLVGDIPATTNYVLAGTPKAYALAITLCNLGDQPASFDAVAASHPIVTQNMYRLQNGRFVQIGQAWAQHLSSATQESLCTTCSPWPDITKLGAGCSTPNSASSMGQMAGFGAKSEVNAATGAFAWPRVNLGDPTTTTPPAFKRLQVPAAEITVGGQYFVSAMCISAEDAAAHNQNNNESYRRVTVGFVNSGLPLSVQDPTRRGVPAIQAWHDHGLGANIPDPGVILTPVDIPSDGRMWVAARATDLGGGQWHYEYAVQNLTSDRAASSFVVPVRNGAVVSNAGFASVIYHSGEVYSRAPWSMGAGAHDFDWTCPETFAQNPNANALRWDTIDNFWFDCNAAPATGAVTIGLFKPGAVGSVSAQSIVAGSNCGTADFNGDGDVGTDADIEAFFACLAGTCCASCATADFNGDGDVGTDSDIEAFFRVLAGGSC